MEDIAFSDWPGQPMDLSGSNPWLPAYGFQPPTALLEKDDFMGHPDAELFLHGSAGQHYVYLETIQEETSDDLRSESDISESRASPVGWLATDSESGSVIRIHTLGTFDSSSEREIACPSKRRKQENHLSVSDDESNQSLSRSSSLIQFESLEKQCQDISSSSPSIFSNFSYDSLDANQNKNISPDSLDKNYNSEPESDYYKTLKIEHDSGKKRRDSFNRYSGSDSNDSTESEDTLETTKYGSCKSINNLKTWRSFDGLHANNNVLKSNKISSENLSEDSGYSDHFCQYNKNKSNSIPNIAILTKNDINDNDKIEKFNNYSGYLEKYRLKNCKGFDAYDGDIYQNFNGNFGVSYQDLSALDKYEFCENIKSPLIDRFIKNNAVSNASTTSHKISNAVGINLESTVASESIRSSPKYNQQTSSEPNLLFSNIRTVEKETCDEQNFFEESCVFVCSVPKDLNLAGELKCQTKNSWTFTINETVASSIAAKNFDLADFKEDIVEETKMERRRYKKKNDRININLKQQKKQPSPVSTSSESDIHYKREGSYLEAMENMLNMSDDEYNPCYRDNTNRSTLVEFDKKILKAISEQSIQASLVSLGSVKDTLDIMFLQPLSSQNRSVKSTPNLSIYKDQDDSDKRNSMLDVPRKSSLINRSSTSSDNEDKTLTSAKSFSGSTSSKGVHFCPVVAEVNWRDSVSTDRDSSFSLSSTPRSSPVKIIKPEPILSASQPELQMIQIDKPVIVQLKESDVDYTFTSFKPRHSISQPILNEDEEILELKPNESAYMDDDGISYKHNFIGKGPGTFIPLKARTSISQPNLNRRDSILHKSAGNEKVYVDKDGVSYKHTILGDVYKSTPTTNTENVTTSTFNATTNTVGHVSNSGKQEVKATKVVSAMEPAVQRRDSSKSNKSGKLGGFFSRIASFRFTKSKNDDKNRKKKLTEVKNVENSTGLRLATKEDYIYIPLKGPVSERNNKNNDASKVHIIDNNKQQDDNACISGKPPLPKLPPRVVGASVKKRTEATALLQTPERRTIDSGDLLPQPMEPMGLIETDLDTEVTVITSGAHVKTRSLMNLGAEAPPRSLAAPQHPNRPHKSMEFLLDKENLKVVEVSS